MQSVNRAMQKDKDELVCGVLDIYGFEIFMVSHCLSTLCKFKGEGGVKIVAS